MKSLFFSALLLLFFYSCKKEDTPFETQIQGKWELRQVFGDGTPAQFYPAGDGQKIEFSGSSYKITIWDGSVVSGNYQLVKESTVDGFIRRIELDGQPGIGYLKIQEGSLIWLTAEREQVYQVFEKID